MALDPMELIAAGLLGAAIVLGTLRLLLGPTTPDRVVAADTLSVIATSALIGLAAVLDAPFYLDVALVYAALSFVGVVAVARALEPEG